MFKFLASTGPTGVGNALPSYMLKLRSLSPIRLGCEAVTAAEFKSKNFVDDKIDKSSEGWLLVK